jgi:hypothetical protein
MRSEFLNAIEKTRCILPRTKSKMSAQRVPDSKCHLVKCLHQCTRKSGVTSEIWTLARTGRTPPPLKNLPLSPSPPDPLFTYLKYTSSPQFAFLHTDTLRLHFRSRSTLLSCLHRLLCCLLHAVTRCYIHGP